MKNLALPIFLSIPLLLHLATVSAQESTGLRQAQTNINNFYSVDGKVFRGGRPSEKGIEDLATLKIETVIDLQGGDIHGKNFLFDFYNLVREPGERKSAILKEDQEVLQSGIKNFYNIPLNSNDRFSVKEAQKVDQILSILNNHEDEPVYVHCQHGKDRTGLIVALYEVKYHHMTPEAAHAEMVSLGHSGALDLLFTGELDKFFWKVAPLYYSESNP